MPEFANFDEFLDWYMWLNPNEEVDEAEAMTIYFNLETYGETI